MKEAYRLLAPEGKFYVTVPSHLFDQYSIAHQLLKLSGLHTLADKYRHFFNKFWSHYHFYEPKKWAQLFEKQGFEVLQIFTYGSNFSCIVNDSMVPFSLVSFLTKKTTNRWVLFPRLKKFFMIPIEIIGSSSLPRCIDINDGGLVFMELTKK